MLSLCTSLTRNAPHFTSRTHHDRTSAHAAARLKPTAPQHLSHLAARNRGAAAEPHLATSGAGGAAARLDDPRSAPRSAGDACGAGPAAAGAGRALFRPGRAAGPHSGGGPGGATGGERRRTRGYALGAMVPPAGARLLPLPGRGPLLGVLLLLLLCSGGGCVPRRRPAGPPVVLGKSRAGGGAGRARSGAVPVFMPRGTAGSGSAGRPGPAERRFGGPWGAAAACYRAHCERLETTRSAQSAAQATSVTGLCCRERAVAHSKYAEPVCLIGPTELNVSCSLRPLISS